MTKKQTTVEDFSYLSDESGEGFEQLTADVMSFPFLKVLQDLSPEIKKTKPEFIEGAEAGMLCNSISGTLFETPLSLVVGKFDRYYIAWKPARGGYAGAFDAFEVEQGDMSKRTSRDPVTGKLTDMETGNTLSDTYVYYLVLPDFLEEGVLLLSLSASQLKEARRLNRSLISTVLPGTTKKARPHHMVWTLTCPIMSNDKGEWNGIKFAFEKFVGPEVHAIVAEARTEIVGAKVDLALMLDSTEGAIDVDADNDNGKY